MCVPTQRAARGQAQAQQGSEVPTARHGGQGRASKAPKDTAVAQSKAAKACASKAAKGTAGAHPKSTAARPCASEAAKDTGKAKPVSYTHLTLPTILLV